MYWYNDKWTVNVSFLFWHCSKSYKSCSNINVFESEVNIAPIKLPLGTTNSILNLSMSPKSGVEFLPRAALNKGKTYLPTHLFIWIMLQCVTMTIYYYNAKLLKPKSAFICEAGMLCLHSGQWLMFKLHLGYWRSWNVGYQGRRSGSHWHSSKESARALNSTKFHLQTLITSLNTPNTIRYMLLIGWWQAV